MTMTMIRTMMMTVSSIQSCRVMVVSWQSKSRRHTVSFGWLHDRCSHDVLVCPAWSGWGESVSPDTGRWLDRGGDPRADSQKARESLSHWVTESLSHGVTESQSHRVQECLSHWVTESLRVSTGSGSYLTTRGGNPGILIVDTLFMSVLLLAKVTSCVGCRTVVITRSMISKHSKKRLIFFLKIFTIPKYFMWVITLIQVTICV